MTLQENFFRHLSKDYSVLMVSAIKMTWKKETTDLADTILRIIRYTEINKGNMKNMVNNINALAMGA